MKVRRKSTGGVGVMREKDTTETIKMEEKNKG